MRFMMLYKPGREAANPPSQEEITGMGKLIGEMAEAIEWTKRFLQVVGEGESEIRLMHEAPACVKA